MSGCKHNCNYIQCIHSQSQARYELNPLQSSMGYFCMVLIKCNFDDTHTYTHTLRCVQDDSECSLSVCVFSECSLSVCVFPECSLSVCSLSVPCLSVCSLSVLCLCVP